MATGATDTHALPPTSYGVLGLLTFDEMSGYDLVKLANRSIGYFWSPAKSQIYSELRRLVALGHATERRVTQRDRPDKRVYRITPKGERALRAWLESPDVQPDTIKSPLLLRMFFGHLVDIEILLAQVKAARQEHQEQLSELRLIERQIAGKEDVFFPYLTLKSGLAYTRAGIRWLDEVERQLLQKKGERERA